MHSKRARRVFSAIAVLSAAVSLGLSGVAHAEPEGEADRVGGYVFDVGVLRPIRALKTVIGAALLVPAYPLAIESQQRSAIVERLVTRPAKDTFTRPIGDF